MLAYSFMVGVRAEPHRIVAPTWANELVLFPFCAFFSRFDCATREQLVVVEIMRDKNLSFSPINHLYMLYVRYVSCSLLVGSMCEQHYWRKSLTMTY